MKFKLTPGDGCRVRILPTLPDHAIARLEGRNGVGKTMAIRLLQLCTGEQPYRRFDTKVWEELRASLGRVEIQCSQLQGAASIEWQIDASLWPETPDQTFSLLAVDGVAGICSGVKIDGKDADLRDVQRLLRVYRLAGDETLVQAIEADVSSLRSAADSERVEVERRSAEVLAFHRNLKEQLTAAAPDTIKAVIDDLSEATKELSQVSEALKSAEGRQDELKALALQKRDLDALVDQHGDPEVYAQELKQKLDEIRAKRESLRNDRDSLKLKAGKDAPALEEIEALENRWVEKRDQRDELLEEAQSLVAKLGLLAVPPGDKEPSFTSPQAEAVAALDDLKSLQANLDAGPQVAALGDRILDVLSDERVELLRERPVATVDAGRRLSSQDLETGIRVRQEEIAEEARPPQAEQLEDEIRLADERLADFSNLGDLLRKVRRRDSELKTTRGKLKNLAEGLAGVEGEKFAELENKEEELAEVQSSCEADLRRVRQQMTQLASGTSAGTIMDRFDQRVIEAETSLKSLDDDIQEQIRQVTVLLQEKETARLEAESCEARLVTAKAAQREALAQMAASEGWKRLRDVDLLPLPNLDDEANQDRINALIARCEDIEAQLDDLSSLTANHILAGLLAAEQREEPKSGDAVAVLRLLEASLGRLYFGHPSVASALFDGGHLARFSLIEHLVEWQPEGSEPVTRHLDAFSSGERAFAYTKTRLEKLRDEPPTQNRFVALDEFGAFLERSRLELLEQYLFNDAVGKFVDQALIILPLGKSREEESAPFKVQPYPS